jgi:hypothetical protein
MMINYDNYESYFLLYVDGELQPAEMEAVESFAVEHPDLAVELDNLLATKLPIANIEFDKSSLLKTATLSPSLQEQLLLLLDNELPSTQKASIEKEIASNKIAAKEFDYLKKVQLNAKDEAITFPNKELLYKKPKVVPFVWWKYMAAAASVALFVTLMVNQYNKKQSTSTGINVANAAKPVEKKLNTNSNVTDENEKPIEQTITAENTTNVAALQTERINKKVEVALPSETRAVQVTETITMDSHAKEDELFANNHTTQYTSSVSLHKPSIAIEKIDVDNDFTAYTENIKGGEIKPSIIELEDDATLKAQYKAAIAKANSETDENIQVASGVIASKSKAGGLLKKIGGFLNKKTQIKLGSGLKVAGFEVATAN